MPMRQVAPQLIHRALEVGLFAGAAVGAGYGSLVPLLLLLPALVQSADLHASVSGSAVGVLAIFIGFFSGIFIGSLAGLMFGLINGCALGLLTVRFYLPLRTPAEYRWSARLICILATLICNVLVVLMLGRVPRELIALLVVGMPLLLTLPCAWIASSRVAQWYVTEGSAYRARERANDQ